MNLKRLKELEKKYHLQILRDGEFFNKDYVKTLDIIKYLENKDIPEKTKEKYLEHINEMRKLTREATNFVFKGDFLGEKEKDWKVFWCYHLIHERSKNTNNFIKTINPNKYVDIQEYNDIKAIFSSPSVKDNINEKVEQEIELVHSLIKENIEPTFKSIINMIYEDLEKIKEEAQEEKDAELVR